MNSFWNRTKSRLARIHFAGSVGGTTANRLRCGLQQLRRSRRALPDGSLVSLFCLSLLSSFPITAQTPPGFSSVKSAPFSAVGDGVSNDYSAFQRALNSSASIYVPAGGYKIDNSGGPLTTFNFSQTLSFAPGASVVCTTPNQGCFGFEGGINPRFNGLHVTYAQSPVDDCRVPNGMCSTLYFRGTTNAIIDSTTIEEAWAIAFGFIDNISGTITHTSLNGATRDGLFLQDNRNLQIKDLRAIDTGDDCMSFHDTEAGGGRHGATATAITCSNIRGGGFAIAGARDVTLSEFIISGTSGPGIYVISDPTHYFLKPTNLVISSGVIRNVGKVPDYVPRNGTQHGILFYGSAASPLGDLTFHDIQIDGSNGSGIYGGGFVDTVTLANIDINDSGLDGPISNASCVSITGQGTVYVNQLSARNCYRSGFLSVANTAVIVQGLTIINAWTKGDLEPGAKAVEFFGNTSVTVDGTVIIDHQAVPTGYVFSERQNASGFITNTTAQILNGRFQALNGSAGVAFAPPAPDVDSPCVSLPTKPDRKH